MARIDIDCTWNGRLAHPVKHLASSAKNPWDNALFVEFVGPKENQIDVVHQHVCIQRFLRPVHIKRDGDFQTKISSSNVAVILPGMHEKVSILGASHGHFLFIDADFIASHFQCLLGAAELSACLARAPNSALLNSLLDCLYAQMINQTTGGSQFHTSVLKAIIDLLFGAGVDSAADSGYRLGKQWARVYQLMQSSDPHNLCVDDLAQVFGLSTRHFTRLFKRRHVVTPYRYMLEQRLEKAHQAISRCDCSLAEIAQQVGFSDQSQFANAYKARYGLPPSLMRKKMRDDCAPARHDRRHEK